MYTPIFICILLVSSIYSQDVCSESNYTILKTPVAAADAAAACTAQNLQFARVDSLNLMNISSLLQSCVGGVSSKAYIASWDGVALDSAYDLEISENSTVPTVTQSIDSSVLQAVLCSSIPEMATDNMTMTNDSSLAECLGGKMRKVLNFDDLIRDGSGLYPKLGEYGGLKWENFYGIESDLYPLLHVFRGTAISRPWAVFPAWTKDGDVLAGIITSDKPFDLTSAQLSGAWDNNSSQIITGTTADGANVTWNAFVNKKPELQNFPADFVNLVRLEIITPDGYSNIVIDDLSFCQ